MAAAEVRWSGPPNCDRKDAVSRQVESIVGRSLASVEALDFEVTVTAAGGAWRVELVTDEHGSKGRRSLAGQSCSEVTDAAAVLMAMAIRSAGQAPLPTDDASAATAVEPGPERAPAPSVPTSETPASAPPPPPPARPVRPVFGLSGVLDTAALPHASPGVAAHVGVAGSNVRLEAEGAVFMKSSLKLDEGRSADFELFSAALLGCVDDSFGPVRAGGCAGFELGKLSGEGHGVSDPHLGSSLWEAGRVEVGGYYPLGHALWLTVRAGVAIPFSRPEFVLDGNPIYQPSALGLRASAGIELLP